MQCSWDDCPADVRRQVTRLIDAFHVTLGDNLIGVYLHGSLAMGCFNPERSDVDLLVVTGPGMSVETKRRVMETLLASSGRPRPIELSFLRESDLRPWRHPAPFDLHYGEGAWRERMQQALASGAWRRWNEETRHDPDLAAHVTVTRARGIALTGAPIEEVFPPVPGADYDDSICDDFRWILGHPDENPVYGVLNACRVLGCAETGRVLSKDEGAVWALGHLPGAHHAVLREALAIYRGDGAGSPLRQDYVSAFLGYVAARLPPTAAESRSGDA
jgi:streptomycin 3"-adenylyltransferase